MVIGFWISSVFNFYFRDSWRDDFTIIFLIWVFFSYVDKSVNNIPRLYVFVVEAIESVVNIIGDN